MNQEQKKLLNDLNSAIKSDNYDFVIEVLTKEVGTLLLKNKKGLISVIKESGGKVDDDIKDTDLAKMIAYALLNRNKLFINNLIQLIFDEKNEYLNDNVSKYVSTGISAIGNAISDAQFGKATKEANADLDRKTKDKQALELVTKFLEKKDEEKLQANLQAKQTDINTQVSKNYAKAVMILGSTLILTLVILGIYKATE